MIGKTNRAILALCILAVSVAARPGSGQTKASGNGNQNSPANDRLAKKIQWGAVNLRLFHDVNAELVFTLATSWIPGEDRKGRFRYKVDVKAGFEEGTTSTLESTEKVLNKAYACDLFLRLQDSDDFELRTIPLVFAKTVNSSMMLVGLSANSWVPMSATEYRGFVGNSNWPGSWTITWNCHNPINN